MTRFHDVGQLTTGELQRARRELQANLGLIAAGSPTQVPIRAHMQAIDAELAERARTSGHAIPDQGSAANLKREMT